MREIQDMIANIGCQHGRSYYSIKKDNNKPLTILKLHKMKYNFKAEQIAPYKSPLKLIFIFVLNQRHVRKIKVDENRLNCKLSTCYLTERSLKFDF